MLFMSVYMFSNNSCPFRNGIWIGLRFFLKAFCRMVNRQGLLEEMLSDNGTSFVGANKELCELIKQMTKDSKVNESLVKQGVKWTFNPQCAPHFGGVFETMIKTAKIAIIAILGNADVMHR